MIELPKKSYSEAELVDQGWEKITAGGFTAQAGPFWRIKQNNKTTLGVLLGEKHCNNHIGTSHGGLIMTFADVGLGAAVADAMGEERFRCVTTSLQTQFVSVARVGEFIYCQAELIRQTSQVLFVRGLIKTGDKTIASAEGIWSVLAARK